MTGMHIVEGSTGQLGHGAYFWGNRGRQSGAALDVTLSTVIVVCTSSMMGESC